MKRTKARVKNENEPAKNRLFRMVIFVLLLIVLAILVYVIISFISVSSTGEVVSNEGECPEYTLGKCYNFGETKCINTKLYSCTVIGNVQCWDLLSENC